MALREEGARAREGAAKYASMLVAELTAREFSARLGDFVDYGCKVVLEGYGSVVIYCRKHGGNPSLQKELSSDDPHLHGDVLGAWVSVLREADPLTSHVAIRSIPHPQLNFGDEESPFVPD